MASDTTPRGKRVVGMGKLQARGQVTLPVEVREALGAKPGDTILFEVDGKRSGRFVVIPTHEPVDALLDRYSGKGPVDTDRLWEQVAEDIAEDVVPKGIRRADREVAAARDK